MLVAGLVVAALLPIFPTPLPTAERAPVPEFITAGHWRDCVRPGGVLVPVPLPTYVTKPVAPRPAGTVDLTRPGAWTEAQQATEVPEQRPASAAAIAALLDDAEAADDQLDTILHRRAIND